MSYFEIHLTGDERIHDLAKTKSLKTIVVDLLRPDFSVLRSEHMTSFVIEKSQYEEVLQYVKELEWYFRDAGLIRSKIESPFEHQYVEQSLYIESHFVTETAEFPISRNRKKSTFLATDREYDQKKYNNFRKIYNSKGLELCLYDSNVSEDADWFCLFKNYDNPKSSSRIEQHDEHQLL